jgi:hypothetical protein
VNQPYERLSRRTRARLMGLALARAALSVTVLTLAYYLLPLNHLSNGGELAALVLGLLGVTALTAWHVRAIVRAPYPAVQAVESLAVIAPLFLLLFAGGYYELGRQSPSDFTQHMTRTDSLYFTTTTFSTVGYGDITAASQGARVMVIIQELTDLIILGLGVRVLLNAVRLGQARAAGAQEQEPAGDG